VAMPVGVSARVGLADRQQSGYCNGIASLGRVNQV